MSVVVLSIVDVLQLGLKMKGNFPYVSEEKGNGRPNTKKGSGI
jgi:hypothetical protein